jgi:hypothetical protein
LGTKSPVETASLITTESEGLIEVTPTIILSETLISKSKPTISAVIDSAIEMPSVLKIL